MVEFRCCILILTAIIVAPVTFADPSEYQSKGFISNDNGEKCWYQQEVLNDNKYFQDPMTNTIGKITFDDPQCMKDSGLGGLDINKMMINNIITRWYSHADANFDTKNLYKTSMAQKKGQCIQSRTYPVIGIVVEYVVSDNSITHVLHGMALQGCKN